MSPPISIEVTIVDGVLGRLDLLHRLLDVRDGTGPDCETPGSE